MTKNSIAIVTGAAGNLGQAVVKKFLAKDYDVIGTIHRRREADKAENSGAEEVELDLLDEGKAEAFIEDVIRKNGRIDVAILTAGGFVMNDLSEAKSSAIQAAYQLNFETAYNIARPVFLQMLKQNSGRIFLIGSQAGRQAKNAKAVVAYSLSKSLLFRLAEIMNAEARGKNVVVSVVVPSTIDTPENRRSMPEADFSTWQKPEEIARVIYWYCTEDAELLKNPIIQF